MSRGSKDTNKCSFHLQVASKCTCESALVTLDNLRGRSDQLFHKAVLG